MAVDRDAPAGPRDDDARPGPEIGLTVSLETYNAAAARHRATPRACFHKALAVELNAQLARARLERADAAAEIGRLAADNAEWRQLFGEARAEAEALRGLLRAASDQADHQQALIESLYRRCRALRAGLRRGRLQDAAICALTIAAVALAALLGSSGGW